MKKLFLLAAIAAMPFIAPAQELKFGYINAEQLLMQMPEISSIETQLGEYSAKLKKELEEMQVEAQKQYEKLQEMLQDKDATPMKRSNQQDLVETLAKNLQNAERVMAQDYQNKQMELIQPVRARLMKAMETVGKKNNFFMIFNLDAEAIVYKADKAVDVTALVKKELDIK